LGFRIFLWWVRAYQEILGDMHNLFGDTDSVDVYFNEQGEIELKYDKQGDLMKDVLDYVDFDSEKMKINFGQWVSQSGLCDRDKWLFTDIYQKYFDKTTYLGKNAHGNFQLT
jgi:arginine decarboxylase